MLLRILNLTKDEYKVENTAIEIAEIQEETAKQTGKLITSQLHEYDYVVEIKLNNIIREVELLKRCTALKKPRRGFIARLEEINWILDILITTEELAYSVQEILVEKLNSEIYITSTC